MAIKYKTVILKSKMIHTGRACRFLFLDAKPEMRMRCQRSALSVANQTEQVFGANIIFNYIRHRA